LIFFFLKKRRSYVIKKERENSNKRLQELSSTLQQGRNPANTTLTGAR
jgi:hypothetical protein